MHNLSLRILPSQEYRRLIDEYAVLIGEPSRKLRFLNRSVELHQKIPKLYKIYPPLAKIAFRKGLLDEAERLSPGSRKRAAAFTREGIISSPHRMMWRIYRWRHVMITLFLVFFVGGIGTAVGALVGLINPNLQEAAAKPYMVRRAIIYELPPSNREPEAKLLLARGDPVQTNAAGLDAVQPPNPGDAAEAAAFDFPNRDTGSGALQPSLQLASLSVRAASANGSLRRTTPKTLLDPHPQFPQYIDKAIWLVEKSKDVETYSNRLQIITSYAVSNVPRHYLCFPRKPGGVDVAPKFTDKIVGILYHASESDILPFRPEMNQSIKKYSQLLVRYIHRHRSYHYFIDRYGRVYRVVAEDQAAYHAGNSIWADEQSVYLNLNHAFIGICFEGRDFEYVEKNQEADSRALSGPRLVAADGITINEAQIRSGKELTDWLRTKYHIRESNCLPHALVSVNPDSFLIGYHLDLAQGFPFDQLGLNDKYGAILPSIADFGFLYDQYFIDSLKGNLWPGIRISEEAVMARAEGQNVSFSEYRKQLKNRYKNWLGYQEGQSGNEAG